MRKLLVVLLVVAICLLSFGTTVAAEKNQVPTKVRVISQSGTMYYLFISVIDLSNNEIVLLVYEAKVAIGVKAASLVEVTRTGMFVNPNEQGSVKGTDGPFPQSQNN